MALLFVLCYNQFPDKWLANSIKNETPVSCCLALVNCNIGVFLSDPCKVQVTSSINLPFNLTESPFCPAARRSWELNNSKLILLPHSHHILSYMPANELFSCLYLWVKQTLLRAALVWSIIKYNAAWKCIRHETRVWTSHSDFPPCYPFCVHPHADWSCFYFWAGCLFYKVFFLALCKLMLWFLLLAFSVTSISAVTSWHLRFNKIMSHIIKLLLSYNIQFTMNRVPVSCSMFVLLPLAIQS